jgi:hypothetical protein
MSSHTRRPEHHQTDWTHELHAPGLFATILIALGVVFLLLNANILSHDSNWWVIFLAIPGLALLWNGYTGYQRQQRFTTVNTTELVFGAILLLLTFIFVFDPTWSFTRNVFPGANWDSIWPFALIIPGLVVFVLGLLRQQVRSLAAGVVLTALGGVFYFKIPWDLVWPFALILVGLVVLLNRRER